jgi:DNA-binding transcriptional LysR family regulator
MPSPFPIPLNAIRAIEIVARRGALAPAADELGVTPGAVSQHLRRAEERLGIELFERTPQGLRPTPALRQMLPQLTAGFTALQDALAGLKPANQNTLIITMGSVFASRWMIWRIGKFSALHPEIETRLVVTGRILDLSHGDVDCAIRYGRGTWPDADAVMVGGTTYRPVLSPVLAPQVKTPADLAKLPIIRDTTTMLSWDEWWKTAGLPETPQTHGPTFDDPGLAFDAAISEQGVLMAVDEMSADAVSDGRLVRPFDILVEGDPLGYWFITPRGRREQRKVKLFREWVLAEFADSAGGYVEQLARRKTP